MLRYTGHASPGLIPQHRPLSRPRGRRAVRKVGWLGLSDTDLRYSVRYRPLGSPWDRSNVHVRVVSGGVPVRVRTVRPGCAGSWVVPGGEYYPAVVLPGPNQYLICGYRSVLAMPPYVQPRSLLWSLLLGLPCGMRTGLAWEGAVLATEGVGPWGVKGGSRGGSSPTAGPARAHTRSRTNIGEIPP